MKKIFTLLVMVALAACWVSCSDDDDKNEPDPTIPTIDEITLTIKVDRNDTFSPFSSPDYFDDEDKKYATYHKIPLDWEVNWGDGQTTGSTTHQYKLEGTYQVTIKGTGITSIWTDESYGNSVIEEIDVTKAPNLVILGVLYQNLKTLDLSKNTALRFLECEYNKLNSLDLSKNVALESLQCMANNLTSLDLSKNIALTYLECCGNKITSLDLNKNTELTSLNCEENPFTQESINDLLNSLPTGKYDNGKSISILWIDDKWDVSIAEKKGWEINPY